MSTTSPPDQSAETASEAPDAALGASAAGLTGQGADSAMAHLRQREEKRDGGTQPPDEGMVGEQA